MHVTVCDPKAIGMTEDERYVVITISHRKARKKADIEACVYVEKGCSIYIRENGYIDVEV